jgi:transposase
VNPASTWRKADEPDYAAMRRELQKHKHLTLQLLWQEYGEQHPEGYGYSRYCGLYRHWLKRQDVVLRHEHRAGEKLFVDYAGDTIAVHDAATGEVRSWGRATTVSRRRPGRKVWLTGSGRICVRLNSSEQCRKSWCRTT